MSPLSYLYRRHIGPFALIHADYKIGLLIALNWSAYDLVKVNLC